MPVTVISEQPSKDVVRLLRYWADPPWVQERLALRHPTITSGQRERAIGPIVHAISQGIELLDSAAGTSLFTRPLPLFYAAESLARGLCLVLDPTLTTAAFQRHGLTREKRKRHKLSTYCCLRDANPRPDVWSQILRLTNADWITHEINLQTGSAIRDQRVELVAPQLAAGRALPIGPLLRELPELTLDLELAGWETPYVIRTDGFNVHEGAGEGGPTYSAHFFLRVGHGNDSKSARQLVLEHPVVKKKYIIARDTLDVLQVNVVDVQPEMPTGLPMRVNLVGDVFVNIRRSAGYLAELPTYFAALLTFSEAVRYVPEEWWRLITNRIGDANLMQRFLDMAERKVPNLVLNELNGGLHLFRASH